MNRLVGIEVFLTAAEMGSFTSAAERLHVTRSAVAKAIAKLESRLNVQLIQRNTRRQLLTEAGVQYFETCKRAYREIEAAEAVIARGNKVVRGRCRVLAPVLFGRRCVAPLLGALIDKHPELELDLTLNDIPFDLLEGGFDVAIRAGELNGGLGVKTRIVGHQAMVVCASPAYLRRCPPPRGVEELEQHSAIIYSRRSCAHRWKFPNVDGRDIEVLPPSRLKFDDLDTISDAAAAGYGLAWLPLWLVGERLRTGELVEVLGHLPRLVYSTHALWLSKTPMSMSSQVVLDALTEGLRNEDRRHSLKQSSR